MVILITVIVIIAFFGASAFIGINNINYDMYDKKITESEIITDFSNYENAIKAYKKTINVYPSNGNWEQELLSIKMLLPTNKGEYRYSYTPNPLNTSLEWVGVCYKDSVETVMFENIESIHEKGMTVLANDCFATDDETINKSGKEISFALTKWVKADWSYVNKPADSGVVPIVPPAENSGKDGDLFEPIEPVRGELPEIEEPVDGNIPLTPEGIVYHDPKPTDVGSKFIAVDEEFLNSTDTMSVTKVFAREEKASKASDIILFSPALTAGYQKNQLMKQ